MGAETQPVVRGGKDTPPAQHTVASVGLVFPVAVGLLWLTPLWLLFRSHGYPTWSPLFGFFAVLGLPGVLLTLWLSRYEVYRRVCLIPGTAVLFGVLTGQQLLWGVGIGLFLVLLLRDQAAVLAIFVSVGLALSALVSLDSVQPETLYDQRDASPTLATTPPVFHFVFDEAAGPEALANLGPQGAEALEALRSVLDRHGFTTVQKAYSSSMWTQRSMSQVLGLSESVTAVGAHPHYRIERAPLFARLKARGHRVSVFQNTYLDYCTSAKDSVDYCYEYPLNSLSYFPDNGLDQLELLGPAVLHQLQLRTLARAITPRIAATSRLGLQQRMPLHFGSLSQPRVQGDFLRHIQEEEALAGQYILVHFMYPHHDYFQNADCTSRASYEEWGELGPWTRTTHKGTDPRITPEERTRYYDAYVSQFRCFTRRLDALLTQTLAAHPDASIILHGDHGARISSHHIHEKPTDELDTVEQLDLMNDEDLLDNYSTLLAFRQAGAPSGSVDCRLSLVAFMQAWIDGKPQPDGPFASALAQRLFPESPRCSERLPRLEGRDGR